MRPYGPQGNQHTISVGADSISARAALPLMRANATKGDYPSAGQLGAGLPYIPCYYNTSLVVSGTKACKYNKVRIYV